jgi:hypothetical protein
MLGTDRGTASRARVYVRLFAAREIGLGLGTLNALRSGADVRPWVVAAAIADAGDAAALVAAARERSVGTVRALAATVFAMAGVAGAVVAVRALSGGR